MYGVRENPLRTNPENHEVTSNTRTFIPTNVSTKFHLESYIRAIKACDPRVNDISYTKITPMTFYTTMSTYLTTHHNIRPT